MSEKRKRIIINADLIADVVDEVVKNYDVDEDMAWEIVTETTIYTAIENGSNEDILSEPMHVLAQTAVEEYVKYLAEQGEIIRPRPVLSASCFALFSDENTLDLF